MESYATKAATTVVLTKLGFERHPSKADTFTHILRNVEAELYQCSREYWCVGVRFLAERELGLCFQAPIVWNGPRAVWDETGPEDDILEFVAFLDKVEAEIQESL